MVSFKLYNFLYLLGGGAPRNSYLLNLGTTMVVWGKICTLIRLSSLLLEGRRPFKALLNAI